MKTIILKLCKCQYILALSFVMLSISITSAQKTIKFKYATEAKKKNADYFDIIKKKKQELESYDLTNINDLKEYKHFNRWAEYWRIRVNADGSFPDENLAYFNVGILDATGKINQNRNATRNSSETWNNIGAQDIPDANGYPNFPQMGRLNAFLRIKHATNTALDILFVGAPNGGLWKSTDGGTTWSPKLDMVAGIGVTDIKTTPDVTFSNYMTKPIYISTGDWDGEHVKSIGVLKSTDGGETFASTGLTYTLSDSKLTGDLVVIDNNTVFVGTATGVSKTSDGGTNWTQVFDAQASNANIGRVAVSGNKIMYTGIFDAAYTEDYTTDSNWKFVSGSSGFFNKLAVTTGENGNFYIQDSQGQVKMYNNAGNNFTNVGSVPAQYNSQQGYNQALIVRNNMMISGEFNGTHSTDNGASWYRSLNGYWEDSSSDGNYIHSDHHRLGKLDGTYQFWSVNDGGLNYMTYSSNNDQKPTIEYKSGKTIVTQHYSVAINPAVSSSDDYVTGNQDNDGFSKVDGVWYAVALGDGIESAINYNQPNVRYATNQNGNLLRSDAGFKGELNGDYDISLQNVPFHHYMELDRTNPNILYVNSSDGILKVTDDGSSLTSAKLDENNNANKFNTHGSLILSVSDSNIIRKIPTDGSGATNITGSQNLGSGIDIESVDFSASNTNIIYVSAKGYNAGNKVFKSTDGGANFTNITSNLPDVIINKILYRQGTNPEILFAATNVGVYFSSTGGTTWDKLGQGLPNVDVKDIEINYASDKLVAATFGRGLWDINIENSTLGINETALENSLELSLYPNPLKNGKLKVSLKDATNVNYEIYNVVGGIVKKGKLNNEIEVDNLPNNIYLIRIYNNNFSITKKFVLAK